MLRSNRALLLCGALAGLLSTNFAFGRQPPAQEKKANIQLEESLEEESLLEEETDSSDHENHAEEENHAEATSHVKAEEHGHDLPTPASSGHSEDLEPSKTQSSPPGQKSHSSEESQPIIGKNDATSVESSATGLIWFGVVFIVLVSLIYLLL